MAARLYPIKLERPLTAELINRIMGHVQSQLSLSFTPPTCKTFCKSLKLWEMKSDRNYRPEQFVKETICKMVLASLGSHEEGERRAR